MEEYFPFYGIKDDVKLQIADFHMTKAMLGWIRGLIKTNLLSTWVKFKEDMRERLGALTYEDKLKELSHLQQTTIVTKYMIQFEELLN